MTGEPGRPARRASRAETRAAVPVPAASAPAPDVARIARMVGASADIVLVLDRSGIVEHVSVRAPDLAAELRAAPNWVGRAWIDTVTVESRPKALALLDAALAPEGAEPAEAQRRHLNHPVGRQPDVAIEYSVMRLDDEPRAIAFGRDLRPLTALQQRLVDAQATLERDYAELRNTEIRYRLLFDETPEPLFVLDARSGRIREANPAGRALGGAATLPGASFADCLDPRGRAGFARFLADMRGEGRSEPLRARLAATRQEPRPREILLAASLMVEAEEELVLVRVGSGAGGDPGESEEDRRFLRAVSQSPDAFVFTDQDACVLGANAAFLELLGFTSIDRLRGRRIDNWLGESGVDFDVLFANLRQRGMVRLFATRLRGERRRVSEVEVSAVSLVGDDRPTYGFAIRDVTRRMGQAGQGAGEREVPRSVEQMSELVGRVPLRDLVRDATDVIERLSIEAALELTNDNRANAAEMLGLSRQSLYVKLRRYGLGDLGEPEPS